MSGGGGRFAGLLTALYLTPPVRHAQARGSLPQRWAESELPLSVVMLLLVTPILAGAWWGARRPGWDLFSGALVGAVGGFALVLLAVIANAISNAM